MGFVRKTRSSRNDGRDSTRWNYLPALANCALDGLERLLREKYPAGKRLKSSPFEGLELGERKLSRPVLRGPGGRKVAWLLGIGCWSA